MAFGEQDPSGKGFNIKKHLKSLNQTRERFRLTEGKGKVGKTPDQRRDEKIRSQAQSEIIAKRKALMAKMTKMTISIERMKRYISTLEDQQLLEEAKQTLASDEATLGRWTSEYFDLLSSSGR